MQGFKERDDGALELRGQRGIWRRCTSRVRGTQVIPPVMAEALARLESGDGLAEAGKPVRRGADREWSCELVDPQHLVEPENRMSERLDVASSVIASSSFCRRTCG
jgi:hypothetical protein